MRGRTILILGALACVVVVVVLLMFSLNAPPPQVTKAEKPANVIVASAGALAVGTLIKPTDLGWGPKPLDALPGTTFDRVWADREEDQGNVDAKTFAEVAGAVTRRRIEQGDVVTKAAVVKPGDSGFLAAVLKPGMRAITVGVTVVTGTAGLIYPGDHVDIILTQNFNTQGAAIGRKEAGETVAQDVRVLAIDQQLQVKTDPNQPGQPGKVPATVTLEVSPDNAERILVASKLGELSMVIRSLPAPGTTPAVADATEAPPPVYGEDVSKALHDTVEAIRRAEPPPAPVKPPVLIFRAGATEAAGTH